MSTDPRRATTWWIAPVLGLVVVVVAVGALVAHSLYHQPAQSTPPVVASTGPALPSAEEPGPATVRFGQDFATFPDHDQVLGVLQTYYDAINARDYDQWRTVVTPALANEMQEPDFQKGFRTTRDGSIFVYRVDTAPQNGLRVLESFTSTQSPGDAPTDSPYPCIRWQVVVPLAWNADSGQWKVDAGLTGSSPQREKC